MPAQVICGEIMAKDPDEVRPVLQAAGISRIDTAARYNGGESERRIGQAKLPKDFVIDTRILYTGPGDVTLSAEAVEKSLTNSLQALGLEKLNVLYAHAPDYSVPIAEQARAFNDQYQKGRLTHLGVSNFQPSMVQEWLDIAEKEGYLKPTVYQGHYNLLVRNYEDTLFPLLRRNGMVFNAYSPLAGGFLLGNFTEDGLQAGSRFANMEGPYAKWYNTPAMHEAVKRLRGISERTGLGMDELSLRWLKYHSALGGEDGIIIGTSKPAQIKKNAAQLAKGPLGEDVVRELNGLREIEDLQEDAEKMLQH